MAEAKGTEVAKLDPAEVEKAYAAILDGEPIEFVSDPEAMAREIAERAKNAGSLDELLDEASLTAWGELADVPVTVHGFHLNPSTFKDGSAVYAVVNIERMDDGEKLLVSVGSKTVLTQLVRALEMGWLPAIMSLKAMQTGSGQTAYRLVSA